MCKDAKLNPLPLLQSSSEAMIPAAENLLTTEETDPSFMNLEYATTDRLTRD